MHGGGLRPGLSRSAPEPAAGVEDVERLHSAEEDKFLRGLIEGESGAVTRSRGCRSLHLRPVGSIEKPSIVHQAGVSLSSEEHDLATDRVEGDGSGVARGWWRCDGKLNPIGRSGHGNGSAA